MKQLKTCPICSQKSMRLVTEPYSAELSHDGQRYSISLPALQFYRCETENCKTVVLPDDADEAVSRELRRVAGLLPADEIRETRLRLGYSQAQFSELLGVPEATVSRWETGGQIQQRGFDRLMRAFFALPELRQYYANLARVG